MKKALSLVLALAIFASCFCGFGSSAQKANLICVDEETADTLIQSAWMPDFGSGEGQHSIPALACWIMGDTPWQDSMSFDTEVKKFGERSIHIKYNTGAKNNYGGVYALIPSNFLEKGKTYTYQAYVKTNKLMGSLGAIINLGAEKASGGAPDGYTGVPHSEAISGTKDWQLLSITFECQYSDPDIYYQFWCTANEVMNGEVWFDGMALVEGSEPVKDYASLAPVAAPNVPTTPSAEPTKAPATPTPVPSPLNGEPSAWAKEEILKALEADLVPEHVNSNYTTDITRSDFCDLIIKMIEKKSGKAIADVIAGYADAKADVSFPDTDSANVIAAAKLGIVNGRSSGAFDPTANITRQEAAKMLALAAKVLGADITASEVAFADADSIYAWAKEFIYYVNTIGVMNGTSTTTPPNFSPLRTYTREQSILTVYRLFNGIITAEAYAGNLLDFTEENISAIWDRQPWEANSEDKFYAWGQPGTVVPSDYKSINNGETSAAFSFTYEDEATVADKNKAAGKVTRAIKVDLSKLNIEANLPHIQGNFLDIYTDNCEADKDYTFFFKVKLSEEATAGSVVVGAFNESSLTDLTADSQYIYSNIDDATHIIANTTATKEWQLVKYTFTAKSPLAGPLTGIVINVGKAAATEGYLYIDGIALVEGRMSDADAFYMG